FPFPKNLSGSSRKRPWPWPIPIRDKRHRVGPRPSCYLPIDHPLGPHPISPDRYPNFYRFYKLLFLEDLLLDLHQLPHHRIWYRIRPQNLPPCFLYRLPDNLPGLQSSTVWSFLIWPWYWQGS